MRTSQGQFNIQGGGGTNRGLGADADRARTRSCRPKYRITHKRIQCDEDCTKLGQRRIRPHDGKLSYWKRRNGGTNPVSLPEFGKDSFVNSDSDGSADLFAKKGNLILRVSVPKGPTAVEMVKAIAKKALPRL